MRRKDIPKKCIDGERHSWKDHLYANESTSTKAVLIQEYECVKCGCTYHTTTRFDIVK